MRLKPIWKPLVITLCMLGDQVIAQPFFIEEIQDIHLLDLYGGAKGTAIGDFNNDGRPDLILAENHRDQGDHLVLMQNVDSRRFVDRTNKIISEIPVQTKGSGITWADYDNDGDLDLFVPIGNHVSTHRALNMLLRNDRGIFVDVASEAGLLDL